ncbi:hypothetical protein SAMN04487920_1602 [Bacillus mycoides]|uniref:hypothetical protein n=1 Tax=Bacillus cereus group TaxID=86661 RepID=UPI0008EEC9DB|nr:hypothetical protein [Bacillus mycoides]OSX86970.1 hypothetical protein BTJ45_05542 [Bacillus mycoides]PEB78953.1 hypothetical protein COM95_24130 [Bacillus cereus]PFH69087.1 hypothetical protein COI61_27790 [Bacillus cereus]SFQ92865.1 hypothetical protein SAMN04487920_1602 [Bacillus mycoides]
MAKKTNWLYIVGLTWLTTIILLSTDLIDLIPNQVVSLSVSVVIGVIAIGANLTGLYLLKKKKY